MANQVSIRMESLNGNIQPRERFLILTPNSPTIKVGRASKSVSKGLMGATENAWFDSPVMSRNHAEISLDLEKNVVTIKDIGSMHGTFLNSRQLPRDEELSIKSGDNIVFGVEVSRGIESFPACGFNLEYEFLPWKPLTAKTFAYPDSSDVEDDGDEDHSEDEMEDMERSSSENDITDMGFPANAAIVIESIDLTRDESEVVEFNMRKATNVACPPLATSSPVLGHFSEVNANKPKIQAQSADYDITIIDDSDSDIESFAESDSSSDEDDEEEQDITSERAPSEPISVPLFSDVEDVNMPQDAEIQRFPSPTIWPEEVSVTSQSGVAHHSSLCDRIEASEDFLNDEDSSNDENMDPITEHGSTLPGAFEREDNNQLALALEASHTHGHLGVVETNFDEYPESAMRHTLTPKPKRLAADMLSFEVQSDVAAVKEFLPRLPSPSDAAMVKSSTQPPPAKAKESVSTIPVHHMTGQSWRQYAARSLGNKSGKHEFFEAREDNRAQLEQEMHGEFNNKKTRFSDLFRARNLKQKNGIGEASIPLYEPCEHQHTFPQMAPPAFPEVINDAKSIIATSPIPRPAILQPVRSKVSIHDIIDDSRTNGNNIDVIGDAKSPNLKRKADEISSIVEKEVQEWASSEQPIAAENISQSATSIVATSSNDEDMGSTSVVANPLTATNMSTPQINHPEQRSAKRLRTFAERAGYIVLGGAGLFSLLVATAPDFL
ncbi:hypothetical protein BP6252_12209 [Coleophoma cylindrospora]|uniref:FHA domain-containing protein n=1 Tax=Coleophoma cylindrospora TaxID=1849047 RepID=A0A3D8QG44_9HELO|nr:hypothetical protein BP6252_12209 [Coleophoma cylindrospora]